MRFVLGLLCVVGVFLASSPLWAAEPKVDIKSGWIGVFPTMPNYLRTYKAPVVNKDKTVYQQSAHYVWMGNDYREATATLACDPEFKTAHTAEALKKTGAEAIKVGKQDAWIIRNKDEGKKAFDKIIVPLGDDKALIIEGIGFAHKGFPTELADRFDAEKCVTALAQPPRTEFGRSLEGFKQLTKGMSLREVKEWIGEPDGDIGSGIHVMEYKLPDQSRVLLGFPSFDKLTYVKHEKDGKTEDLLSPAQGKPCYHAERAYNDT